MQNKEIHKTDFFIIGSAKCGTTTLADILASHPQCCFSKPKEVAYFSYENNFKLGNEWYKQAFSHYNGEKLIGEATPNYSDVSAYPYCAERIYQYNPEAKIIYIVRNPIKKLVSGWKMHFFSKEFFAEKGFEYYIKYSQNNRKLLDNCKYNYQISFYEKYFPKSKILILFLEDLESDPEYTVAKLMNFLNLDLKLLPRFDSKGSNRADKRRVSKGLFLKIREKSLFLVAKKIIPSGFRELLRNKFAYKKSITPKPIVSKKFESYLLDYLKQDSDDFLKKNSKPENFWNYKHVEKI